jgi:GST-like protein
MIYLAEKSGNFFPKVTASRMAVLEWLMFQMGSVGPMLGQAHHFRKYAKTKIPYAVDRYTQEATRIYTVLDKRLSNTPFLAGEYSIADMAVYPWLRPYRWQGQELSEFSNLQRWYSAVRERPAVQRGLAVMGERLKRNKDIPMGDAWDILFGSRQSDDEKQNKPHADKGSRS